MSVSIYLQAVTDARQRVETDREAFRAALLAARPYHSLAEIARAAGLSRSGVRFLTMREETDDSHSHSA